MPGRSRLARGRSFYRLTRAGRAQVEKEARAWQQTATILARFFSVKASS